MNKSTMPVTVQRWVNEHPEMVDDAFVELDYCDPDSPYSIWIYLNLDYICPAMECSTIHEGGARDTLAMLKTVRKRTDEERN